MTRGAAPFLLEPHVGYSLHRTCVRTRVETCSSRVSLRESVTLRILANLCRSHVPTHTDGTRSPHHTTVSQHAYNTSHPARTHRRLTAPPCSAHACEAAPVSRLTPSTPTAPSSQSCSRRPHRSFSLRRPTLTLTPIARNQSAQPRGGHGSRPSTRRLNRQKPRHLSAGRRQYPAPA